MPINASFLKSIVHDYDESQKKFSSAIDHNDLNLIKELLEKGFDLNSLKTCSK